MQGLPASGKSTRAKEIIEQSGNTVRINKDLLRKMLHFDKHDWKNEERTRAASRLLTKYFLDECNVIVDDTNLNERTLQSWKGLAQEKGVKHQVVKMDTTIGMCLIRDKGREGSVGPDVIVQMAMRNSVYPIPQKGFVLVDIDGTLANCSHRQHFLEGEKKDWTSFFSHMSGDTVRLDVLNQVRELADEGYEIVIVSARPEDYRAKTIQWLEESNVILDLSPATVIMRRSGDKRPDTEVKLEMYEQFFKDKYPIHCVFDDRPRIIEMWQSQGLSVVDVGQGIDF